MGCGGCLLLDADVEDDAVEKSEVIVIVLVDE
jgi:hypothetical protein